MQARFDLLRLIAIAVWKSTGAALGFHSVADSLPEISDTVWNTWSYMFDAEQRQKEVETLLQVPADELREAISSMVLELLPSEPIEVRQTLISYLQLVPAGLRQAFRRPADAAGTSMPPGIGFGCSEDLLTFLPARLSRFKVGDSPMHNLDWNLVELLGVSGFGEVWKASHPDLTTATTVVLKFCLDPPSAKVMRSQARLQERLILEAHHPGIVALRQTYLNADPPCLVYDYVPGGDLVGVIRDWHSAGSKPSPARAARVMRRLARIVGFAHQLNPPIVHRNLKPANILVQSSGTSRLLFRIADYGNGDVAASHAIRQALRGATKAQLQVAAAHGTCTPLYASPQQMRGSEADPRDDVYALGIIWYQILTGNLDSGRPADDAWMEELVEQGMSRPLIHLLEACMAENPADRPSSAIVLLDRLQVAMSGVDGVGDASGVESSAFARRMVNSIGMTLTLVPAGVFRMGSSAAEAERGNDEGPQHEVSLSQPFYMGIYPVTQRQYEAVMGQNPSYFAGSKGGGYEFPVETISWQEANEFCRRLSALPAERAAHRFYRLPTEAEWEYACRGGVALPFSSGITLTSREANFNGNYPYGIAARGPYLERTTKVGSYPPNPFGLFDMHGNVWEWCLDFYDRTFYRNSPRENPLGPETGSQRVVRGGSCFNIGRFCRSAYRLGIAPGNRNLDVGIRVVMVVEPDE
jgi:formylglycine-generating enzyme required for sulfatase activity